MTSRTFESPVQAQVEAYNVGDIDAFVAVYHGDIEIFDFPDIPVLKGHEALRARYERRFAENPDLHAEIHHRFTAGNRIVDYETVRGTKIEAAAAVVIYEVQDGLIRRAWFVRDTDI